VSKARARARAERAALAADRAAETARRREREAAARVRRERRAAWWRSVRLWQHGPAFRRHRATWGALGTLVFVLLVVVYVFSGSLGTTFLVALVCVVASPLLVMLFFDRSRR
jgi:Flp pilus assembly protein TadB